MMLFKLLLYLAMREETSSHPPVYVLQKWKEKLKFHLLSHT
jgi:hypothetical protein